MGWVQDPLTTIAEMLLKPKFNTQYIAVEHKHNIKSNTQKKKTKTLIRP